MLGKCYNSTVHIIYALDANGSIQSVYFRFSSCTMLNLAEMNKSRQQHYFI